MKIAVVGLALAKFCCASLGFAVADPLFRLEGRLRNRKAMEKRLRSHGIPLTFKREFFNDISYSLCEKYVEQKSKCKKPVHNEQVKKALDLRKTIPKVKIPKKNRQKMRNLYRFHQ